MNDRYDGNYQRCVECSRWKDKDEYPNRSSVECSHCQEWEVGKRRRRREMALIVLVGGPDHATDKALRAIRTHTDSVRPAKRS